MNKLCLSKTYDFVIGDGIEQTLVFLHGLAADSSTWGALFEYLKETGEVKNTRVVAFDLLGAGQSEKSDELEYNFEEQLMALDNSLVELNIGGPITLVGHSMGTFIATRYAATHPEAVQKLVLISAPVYTPENLADPAFGTAMEGFKKAVAEGNSEIVETKAFNNAIKNIVMAPDNFEVLANTSKPTIIIYGDKDALIGAFNLPTLKKQNANIKTVETPGGHGVSPKKFAAIKDALKLGGKNA